MKRIIIILLASVIYSINCFSQSVNILDFGARSDANFVNTKAIQDAIDYCTNIGGGTVFVPAGTFVTEMVRLKSNVDLHLSMGAKLQASGNGKYLSLILFDGVENASVSGKGTLFGNGKEFTVGESAPNRPYIIFIRKSKHIGVEGVTLNNSASWALRMSGSENIIIHRIKIYSHANYNNDGIDIDSKDVVISDCIVDTGDDALCFKSEDRETQCENVVVTNCILRSNCNFIKMGTGSLGGFRNIAISNCALHKSSESSLHHWNVSSNYNITDSITGISGIALEIVDGGTMEQVTISNITMTGVQTPVFIRLGSRKNPTGILKNILISNVIATSHSKIASSITAVPGFHVENVTLRDIFITNKLSVASPLSKAVPEKETAYPENRMFGWELPSYGFYIRHAKNITLENIRISLLQPDARPAFWLEDAHNVRIINSIDGENQLKEKDCSNVKIFPN